MKKPLLLHVSLFLLSSIAVFTSFGGEVLHIFFLAIIFSLSFLLQVKQKELTLLQNNYKDLQKKEHLSVPHEAMLGLSWNIKDINLLEDFISLHSKEKFQELPLFEVIWRLKRLYEVEFLEENIKLEIVNEAKKAIHVKLNALTYAIYILLHNKKMNAKVIKLHIYEKKDRVILDITSDTQPMKKEENGFLVSSTIIKKEHKGEFTINENGYSLSFSQNI